MPPICPPDEGRLEEVSTCALRTCEPLACTAGYLRSLAIWRLASDRKYLAHFYMPLYLHSISLTPSIRHAPKAAHQFNPKDHCLFI